MKEFKLNYNVRPENLLFLAMVSTYKSMAGVVNAVFTFSMALLLFRFRADGNFVIKLIIVLGIMVFPVFQPLFIYLRSRKIVSNMSKKIDMTINKNGIELISNGKSTKIVLSNITNLTRIGNMIIIYTDSLGSYVLNKQTLNGKGMEIYNFLKVKNKYPK